MRAYLLFDSGLSKSGMCWLMNCVWSNATVFILFLLLNPVSLLQSTWWNLEFYWLNIPVYLLISKYKMSLVFKNQNFAIIWVWRKETVQCVNSTYLCVCSSWDRILRRIDKWPKRFLELEYFFVGCYQNNKCLHSPWGLFFLAMLSAGGVCWDLLTLRSVVPVACNWHSVSMFH